MINKGNVLFYDKNTETCKRLISFFGARAGEYNYYYETEFVNLKNRINSEKYDFLISSNKEIKNIISQNYDLEYLFFDFNELVISYDSIEKIYNKTFYTVCTLVETPSAKIVTDTIIKMFSPSKILDVGCGAGIYLKEFNKKKIEIVGIDKNPIAVSLCPSDINVYRWDLHKNNKFPVKFDTSICFEVAEHIPNNESDSLVKFLTNNTTKQIIFSSAPPGQGGIGHINEQPFEFWIKKFNKNDFSINNQKTTNIRKLFKEKNVVEWLTGNTFIFEKI